MKHVCGRVGMAPALSNDDCVLCLTVTNRLLSKCLPVKPNVQGIAAHVDAWDSLVSIFTCMARRTVTSLVLEDSSREERQAHISGLCKLAARLSAFRLEGGMREGSMGIAAIELGRRENLQAMNDLSAMLHEKAMRMKEDASPGAEEEAVWLLALAVCCPGMALAVRAACQGSHLEGWLELEQLRDGIAAIAAAWVGLAQVDSHCPELEIVGVFAVLGVALTNVRLFLKKEDDALPTTRTYPGARLRIWLQIGVNAAEMHACVPRMPGLLKNKNCANPSSNLLVFASDIGIMATKVSLKNEDRHNDREACLVAIQAATLANKVALAHTHLTPRAWERLYPRKRIVPVLLPDHEERILAEAAFERIFMLGQLYMKVATATLPGMIDADTSAADPDCKM